MVGEVSGGRTPAGNWETQFSGGVLRQPGNILRDPFSKPYRPGFDPSNPNFVLENWRFISKYGDKCLSFFKALKKVKDFEWTTESQEAFEKLKKYMAEAPLLAKPSPEDTLYLYLAASDQALGAVLVMEERKVQKPVYYVSKILHGAELNYYVIEKFALALITALRKLRPYFQAHKIEVLTDQPLRSILHSPKASGRLIKWAIELGEFDIKYKP
ncbi:hypothetical protein POM88_034195 [Heracleum sosnowskyi]|uniref:Reverse transcriptase/retrotransposon-derived protein RNase H-like domain-containing protein n=1 Tax=Heracleum sosnowskyi TaxID=360622 RepID=A0AAD8MDC8_9APIA|nr:hypothetical protein POM88_034195 [Heracleum sosnowskyi]